MPAAAGASELHFLPFVLIFLSPHLLPFTFSQPAPAPAASASPFSVNGFACAANVSIYPCSTYAFFRAPAAGSGFLSPSYDLASVADLFYVSRLAVARSTNLSSSAAIFPGEPFLIPINCGCPSSSNLSYAAVPYQINAGDTFYLVSTNKFQNLTRWPAVEVVNPTLVATDLTIGVVATFPIFCQCPAAADSGSFLRLVSYVMQPSDTYASIAAAFGTNASSLVRWNGPEAVAQPFSVLLVPTSQFPPPILTISHASPSAAQPPAPEPAPAFVGSARYEDNKNWVILGLAVALGVVGALWLLETVVLACAWMGGRRLGIREKMNYGRGPLAAARSGGGGEKLMTDITEWLDRYRVYKVEELRRATDDFDEGKQIQGGTAVYKGVIDGEMVAVKKMRWDATEELKILQKVNHSNLVKLDGFCIDAASGSCFLVYEFVENGSLDLWLHDAATSSTRYLNWHARLRIALDIAHGLQYIHEHTWPRVVHKDIKSSNILLDANLRAKIANFGLARSGQNAVTTHIVGTQGYIAPEYLSDGLVTTKIDVFAYGVVLLELVSGREVVRGEDSMMLWVEAEQALFRSRDGHKEARVREWMDARLLKEGCPLQSVVSLLDVAKLCLQRDPSKRPTMVEVAFMLSKSDEMFSDYSGEGFYSTDGSAGAVVGR